MLQFLYRQRAFLFPFGLLWLALGYTQVLYSQNYLVVALNHHWTPFLDVFFSIVTYLGDGVFVVGVALLLAYFSWRKGLLVLAGYIGSGIFVQLVKRFVFPDAYRPAHVLAEILPSLHTVADITLHQRGSFPSGHTTSAFTLFATLAFFNGSPWLKAFWLLCALAVGCSRVYLLQHFPLDAHIGAMLGTVVAVLVVYYGSRASHNQPRRWLERGGQDLFRTKKMTHL